MARKFSAFKGKTLCRKNDTECRTRDRSLQEIHKPRRMIDGLGSFIIDVYYGNINDFVFYVACKVSKTIAHLKNLKQQALSNGFHRMG